jgi:hypothetical protein
MDRFFVCVWVGGALPIGLKSSVRLRLVDWLAVCFQAE